MTLAIALTYSAVQLDRPVEPGATEVSIRMRAELGVRPAHEVVFLTGRVRPSVATWEVQRAQEGTSAEDWQPGTPLAFVRADDEPVGEATLHLATSMAADSDRLDLRHAYRRLRIEDEVVWVRSLTSDPTPTPGSSRTSHKISAARGQEGTAATAHAAGAAVAFLGPGEAP